MRTARGRRVERRLARAARLLRWSSTLARPRRRDLCRDHRATRPVRRGHAHALAGLPRAAARGVRPLRHAPDRGRDRGGIRPHRHAVRVRTGGHHARFPVPVEGPHGRLSAAVGRADGRGRVRGVLRRVRTAARIPAFAQLYRQRARLHGGARHARHLRGRRRDRAQSRARRAPRRSARRNCSANSSTSPKCASAA